MVSTWIFEWIVSRSSDHIRNAFKNCGLVPKEEFDLNVLYPPLKALFQPKFDICIWNEIYVADVTPEGKMS